MRPVRCPNCGDWRPDEAAAEEHCAAAWPEGRCPHCGGDLTSDDWCSRCQQNPQAPLDVEVVDDPEVKQPASLPAVIDAEIVDDGVTVESYSWLDEEPGSDLEIPTAVAVPTGPTMCWWRLGGPNLQDNMQGRLNQPTLAHNLGVVDVREPATKQGLLGFVWKDDSVTWMPVADYHVKWHSVTVKEGWSDAPEDTTHHVKLQFVDILVARPLALPDPTPWQRMTAFGDTRYPGEDLHRWTFQVDGMTPGQYPPEQPAYRPRRDVSFSIQIGTREACRVVNEQSQIEDRRRELEQ